MLGILYDFGTRVFMFVSGSLVVRVIALMACVWPQVLD